MLSQCWISYFPTSYYYVSVAGALFLLRMNTQVHWEDWGSVFDLWENICYLWVLCVGTHAAAWSVLLMSYHLWYVSVNLDLVWPEHSNTHTHTVKTWFFHIWSQIVKGALVLFALPWLACHRQGELPSPAPLSNTHSLLKPHICLCTLVFQECSVKQGCPKAAAWEVCALFYLHKDLHFFPQLSYFHWLSG